MDTTDPKDPRTRYACVHDTKTHFSKYLEDMRFGLFDRLIVRRYQKPVAVLMSIESLSRTNDDRAQKRKAAWIKRVKRDQVRCCARVLSAPPSQKRKSALKNVN